MAGPVIESVFPSSGATGVVVGAPVWVIFDVEVDESTIPGNFMVEGPDQDTWTGPDMALWDRPDTIETEFIPDSPDFKGIVQGVFTFEYLDTNSQTVSGVSSTSGVGSAGSIYKQKVTFTPTNILSPTTPYTVYISGDEDATDEINVGISTRTVFDSSKGLNSGDGDIVGIGGYTGDVDDVLRFEITTAGSFGAAEYEWYRDSESLFVRTGTVSAQRFTLPGSDGVCVEWEGTSTTPFQVGDTFSIVLRPPVYMDTSSYWSFTTGSGNITAVGTDTSTSPIGTIGSVIDAGLEIISLTPDIRENVLTSTNVITIEFNKDIDASTVTDSTIEIWSLPVNGDPSIGSERRLMKILRVEDNKIYAILQTGEDPTA